MKARLGAPKALTAAAHKLTRIVYQMVTTHQEFDATVFESLERSCQHRKQIRLRAQARELGFDLVKIQCSSCFVVLKPFREGLVLKRREGRKKRRGPMRC